MTIFRSTSEMFVVVRASIRRSFVHSLLLHACIFILMKMVDQLRLHIFKTWLASNPRSARRPATGPWSCGLTLGPLMAFIIGGGPQTTTRESLSADEQGSFSPTTCFVTYPSPPVHPAGALSTM